MDGASQRSESVDRPGSGSAGPLWTVQDVAQYLRVPVNTIYKWRQARLGPRGYRVGKHLRFSAEDVNARLGNRKDDLA